MRRSIRLRPGVPSLPLASGRWPALAAGVLWLAAGLSIGYWVLQVWGRSPVTPVASVAPPAVRSDVASVARALGAAAPAAVQDASPAPVAASSRWRLLGVVAQPGQQGAALISMDGQPPRPYAVGAALDGGLVLQAVDRQGARLGPQRDGPTTVQLSLPETPSAAN